MTPSELLRRCADVVEAAENEPAALSLTLAHKKGGGRFAFLGGDTELLCVNSEGDKVYSVPVERVLAHMTKWLKAIRHPPQSAPPSESVK